LTDFRIIYDQKERVSAFVSSRLESADWGSYTAIGLERSGELIAGVVYDGYTGTNIFMHVAAIEGKRWLVRKYLHACFAYPFGQLGCRRITGSVAADNGAALRLDFHLGFEYETQLKDALPSGDLIMLVMWKEKCRWLNISGVQSWETNGARPPNPSPVLEQEAA
jgi:RimJ/RimL family protein N-acetyltransferase